METSNEEREKEREKEEKRKKKRGRRPGEFFFGKTEGVCPGCKKKSPNQQTYNKHKRRCPQFQGL